MLGFVGGWAKSTAVAMETMTVSKITPYLLYNALHLLSTILIECPNVECVYYIVSALEYFTMEQKSSVTIPQSNTSNFTDEKIIVVQQYSCWWRCKIAIISKVLKAQFTAHYWVNYSMQWMSKQIVVGTLSLPARSYLRLKQML